MKKLMLIPFMLVFFIAAVSAASVTTSLFYDATTGDSYTMLYGEQVGVIISADSIFESSMEIKLELLDSSSSVVAEILDVQTTSDSYYNYLMINPGIYPSAGEYTILSTVTAASGQTDSDELYLTVQETTPGNNAPVILSTPLTEIDENQFYSYQIVASDADGDTLSYSFIQNPGWLIINSNTGLVSGVAPEVEDDYQYIATVRVSDGTDFVDQAFTIDVLDDGSTSENNAPVIESSPITVVGEGSDYSYQVVASDADGDSLSYSLVQSPNWLSISDSGLVSGTAPEVSSDEDFSITIQVSDGIDSVSQSYTLTVEDDSSSENNAPSITSSPLIEINETEVYSYQIVASDADGDSLSYSLVQSPNWLSISDSGLVSGTAPNVTNNTVFGIIVSVSDGTDSDSQSYSLTVYDVSEDDNSEDDSRSSSREGQPRGVNFIEEDGFYSQKYFDQFNSRNIVLDEGLDSVYEESRDEGLVVFFVILCILTIGLLGWLVFVLFRN